MAYTSSARGVAPEDLVCVPDLTGMSDVDCARLLRQRGLLISMAGTGICIKQNPAAGEYIRPGSSVHVVLRGQDEE